MTDGSVVGGGSASIHSSGVTTTVIVDEAHERDAERWICWMGVL